MITLIKIGFNYYLVRNATAAAQVINGLARCIQLRNTYNQGDSGTTYYPEKNQDEVGMVTVRDNQILPCKPGETIEEDSFERKVWKHTGRKRSLLLNAQSEEAK